MLVSPSAPVPVPSDLVKATNEAKNNITLAEAEYRRLVELQIAKEMDVVELVKRKAYEEDLIAKLTPKVKLLQDEVSELEKKVSYLKDGITAEQVVINSKIKELSEREAKCKEIENDLEQRKSILTTNENQYIVKRDELRQQIFAHNTRVDILTKAIQSCSNQV